MQQLPLGENPLERFFGPPDATGLCARLMSYDDYQNVYVKWWQERSFTVLPRDFLPTVGLLTYRDGEPILGTWMYMTDSQIAWAAWFLRNPKLSSVEDDVWELLVDEMKVVARQMGKKQIFASIQHPRLIKQLTANGFVATGAIMTHMFAEVI